MSSELLIVLLRSHDRRISAGCYVLPLRFIYFFFETQTLSTIIIIIHEF